MEGVVASLANRLDALVVSIQHVDVDDTDELENFCVRLESLYADLIETDLSFGGLIPSQVIQNVFECWKQFQDVEVSIPGRPAFEISPSALESLMDLQFTSQDIATILGVSRSTVCRRMSLSYETNYCCISDQNLDEIVTTISAQHPGCGSKMMNGHLRAQGIITQQIRIRESLQRTDPEGIASRLHTSVRRRVYNVPAPQYLWHIDGNHKLVRYDAFLCSL